MKRAQAELVINRKQTDMHDSNDKKCYVYGVDRLAVFLFTIFV